MSATDDRDVERYLKRDDALSRAYAELKSERPSPALDQAVLARARDALKAAPRSRVSHQRRWTALTALAATVLLSFGLVMRLAVERDTQLPAAPAQQPLATPPAESTPAAAANDGSLAERDSSGRFAVPPPLDAPPAPSSIEGQRPAIESKIRAAAEEAPAVPEPVPPTVVTPGADYSLPASAPAQMDAQDESTSTLKPMRQERTSGVGARQDAARAKKSQSTVAEESSAENVVGASSAEGEQATRANKSFGTEDFTRTPETWLEEIARLRAAGETEAADRELERFRKVYPEYLEKLQPHAPEPQ